MSSNDNTLNLPPTSTDTAPARPKGIPRVLLVLIGLVFALLIGIQFIPVSRTNPPVTATIKWDSPKTQALFQKACADCHSNQTVWPAMAYVAPASWVISNDVVRGRRQLNFSTLGSAPVAGQSGFDAPPFPLALLGQLFGGGRRFGGGDRPGGGEGFPPPNGGQGFPGGDNFGNRNALTSQNISRMLEGISRQMTSGAMPPANYIAFHPEADLTQAERDALISGLTATLNQMAQPASGTATPAAPSP